ncbi:PcfJ domain-containing protein [Clostridium perfringens]|uniref:PcfJ domain-containing protein n=1 Tax=Clostridium perfringens TaxID=1502 RepID=UPI0018E45158|nr:PcfJ domain-containing protein [Clostridium perfringens]MBI6052332.1 PcfJ domain-containing protein [Clostridium perfringens]
MKLSIDNTVSKEVKEYVESVVFKKDKYTFFENIKKKQKVYCSNCGEYETEGLKHNEECTCRCGNISMAKNIRFGRKNLFESACLYWFEVEDGVLTCRGYYVSKDYSNYKEPFYNYSLQAIYKFPYGEKSKMYLRNYYTSNTLQERVTVFRFNKDWLAGEKVFIANFKEAIAKTEFKYMPYFYEEYIDENIVKELSIFSCNTYLEQLYKVGFKNIVRTKIQGESTKNSLNTKGKDIYSVLKIKKDKLNELRNYGAERISTSLLKLYQAQIKDKSNLTIGELENIIKDYYLETILKINKYVKLRKISSYLEKQFQKSDDSKIHLSILYRDYLDMAKRLNKDMKDKSVLYPKSIKQDHDKLVKLVKVEKNKILDKKIEKRLENINSKYGFEYKKLFMRAANSTEDLIIEGNKLKHCVAVNYTDKYANGETVIMFIRNKDKPLEPYYTVEIYKNSIHQVRGYKNKSATEDVEEFVKQFKRNILNKKNIA